VQQALEKLQHARRWVGRHVFAITMQPHVALRHSIGSQGSGGATDMRACDIHVCVTGLRRLNDDVTQTQHLLVQVLWPDWTHAPAVLLWLRVPCIRDC
jgi:hypothetical protein